MEVRAHSKAQILRNLGGYVPVLLFAALFYFAIVAAGFVLPFRLFMSTTLAWILGIAMAAALVGVGGALYVRFVVNRLAQYCLALEPDTLLVRGQSSRGLIEKRYRLGDIAAITFGEKLDATEQFLDRLHQLVPRKTGSMELIKDLKGGRMLITEKSGGSELFHFIDKVFDLNALASFCEELSRRGVMVGGPA